MAGFSAFSAASAARYGFPEMKVLNLLYEYFHGDNGAGLGASHQTGWTGLVALLLDLFGHLNAKIFLETAGRRIWVRVVREMVGGEAAAGSKQEE